MKEPALEVILKLPLVVETSAVVAFTVQYRVVALATFVVVTFTVALAPSFVEALATLYVGVTTVTEVSFMVIDELLRTVPDTDPLLR